ncbi:hypothetical protein KBD45_07710, partial [Candidatus Dojkabacteria bacterium]|nr:hypothetical protein [Candidatus Dojkabacteria bacterium]
AKILHASSLFLVALLMVFFQGVINLLSALKPDILGYASQISATEIVRITNIKRAEAGLGGLTLNQTLSSAAYTKGRDMIDRDYWAHVSPDGTQPWKFFSEFGYKYRYAGENLARDFSNASAAVDAWMNSPTHRENMLNPKYKEIGIGVVEGDLAGSDTTIIVQFFGARYTDTVREPLADKGSQSVAVTVPEATSIPDTNNTTPIPEVKSEVKNVEPVINQQILVSPFVTTKNTSFVVVALLLIVFLVDAFLVSKRRITRIAGRTFAHFIFLAMILTIVVILKNGRLV